MMNVGPIVPRGQDYVTLAGKPFEYAGISAKHENELWPYTAWEAYPADQVVATAQLTRQIGDALGLELTKAVLVGHEDVDPTRKSDPGPAWSWLRFIRELVKPVDTDE
jgi:N-acetylmuramoyl-L-alanine amidase